MRKGSVVTWLHSDHLGSASLATDLGGIPVPGSETRYKPFGEIRFGSSGLPTDRRFTGYARERAGYVGSLDFAQARYYSPYLGRFISADTLVPRPGDPQSLNRYAFVRNSPLVRIDPSGHFDIPTWENVHDFLAGANFSLISANALAVSESDRRNLLVYTSPLGESRDSNAAYQAGQISGSVLAIVQGGFEIGGGIAAGGSGAAACGTGVLCVAGAPMLAGGVALAGHGSLVATNGAVQLAQDLPVLFHGARELRKNMEAGGESFAPWDSAHHIVPNKIGYGRADEGRTILNEVGIGINEAVNGVKLPWFRHQSMGLHKMEAVNEVVRRLARVRGNKKAIIRELGKIHDEIGSNSFTFPE